MRRTRVGLLRKLEKHIYARMPSRGYSIFDKDIKPFFHEGPGFSWQDRRVLDLWSKTNSRVKEEHKVYNGFYDNFYRFFWWHQERAFCSASSTPACPWDTFCNVLSDNDREREKKKERRLSSTEWSLKASLYPTFSPLSRARKTQYYRFISVAMLPSNLGATSVR